MSTGSSADATTGPTPSQHLATAVREIESHAAASGWDQPAQVFALVDTAELLRHEPQLAQVLGITDEAPVGLTPVEQEAAVVSLEELLPTIAWPQEVAGAAVVLEATTTPPETGAGAEAGQGTPESAEARVAAGVLRTGESFCAIRHRAHDDDTMVLGGADLVPSLLELLHATFAPDPGPHPPGEAPENQTESHHE